MKAFVQWDLCYQNPSKISFLLVLGGLCSHLFMLTVVVVLYFLLVLGVCLYYVSLCEVFVLLQVFL